MIIKVVTGSPVETSDLEHAIPEHEAKKVSNADFRWCYYKEQFVPVSVCMKEANKKSRCQKCYGAYNQLSLPFEIGFAED